MLWASKYLAKTARETTNLQGARNITLPNTVNLVPAMCRNFLHRTFLFFKFNSFISSRREQSHK